MPLPSPTAAANPFGSAPAPVLDPAPLFLFSASADRYEVLVVDGEAELVPVLSRHTITPGIHGVTTRGDAPFDPNLDTEAFRSRLSRNGEVVIPLTLAVPKDLLPPGVPEGSYLRRLEVRAQPGATRTSTHHHEAWEVIGTDRRGNAAPTYDRDRYTRWRLWLRNQGHAPAPSDEAKAILIRNAEQLLERRRQTPSADAGLKAQKVEEASTKLEAARIANATPRPKAKAKKDAVEVSL